MIRQRTTIFNPTESNDGVIESVDSSHLQLSSIDYHCEDKFVLQPPKFKHIEKLRIQLNQFHSQLILFNKYQPGLNIYCKPKVEDEGFNQAEFFDELNQIMSNLFDNIPRDGWINSLDTLFYHVPSIDSNKFIGYIKKLTEDEFNVNLEDRPNVEYIYEGEKTILKLNGKSLASANITNNPKINKEIGLFLIEKGISTEDDIVLSGLRVLLNGDSVENDEYLQKTLFHVKKRQRQSIGAYESNVEENGMHPFLTTTIHSEEPKDDDLIQCKLYYYLDLSKSVFVDKYQLPKEFTSYANFGNTDLELPEYKISEWGSELLMEIENHQQISLPLHSRYQLPSNESGIRKTNINNPLIFYGCDVKDSYLLEGSPFDNRLDFGGNYERFFTDNTVFYHLLSPESQLNINIPRGNTLINKINNSTNLVFIVGVLLIFFKIVQGFLNRKPIIDSKKNE
mmetsp:Transcript_40/g.44  ORF Transcript_40/g.44 Transcript_40/m.44 type:complete len:452 (+) Transcript_40:31-1386(+)